MAVLQAASMGDLLKMTLKDLGEPDVTDLSTDIQDFVAMRVLLKENQVKLDAGTSIQFNVRIDTQDNFGWTGMYASDQTNVKDQQVQAEVPWRHAKTSFAMDERELAMNRSPRKIIDIITDRRYGCMVEQAEGMEDAFWSVPATTSTTLPYGVPYWIVKSSTAATYANNDGFNGLMASGYTDTAGLSTTTYPRWRNYSDAYTDISTSDLVVKWRRAATKTLFRAPVQRPSDPNTGDKYGYFTNYDVIAGLENTLLQNNDNLGNDIASKDGLVTFRRVDVTDVPKLQADTTGPVYGINWGVFKTYILRGFWMREVKIEMTPGQHTVSTVFFDSSLQFVCKDRRRNFVISTGTSLP